MESYSKSLLYLMSFLTLGIDFQRVIHVAYVSTIKGHSPFITEYIYMHLFMYLPLMDIWVFPVFCYY